MIVHQTMQILCIEISPMTLARDDIVACWPIIVMNVQSRTLAVQGPDQTG